MVGRKSKTKGGVVICPDWLGNDGKKKRGAEKTQTTKTKIKLWKQPNVIYAMLKTKRAKRGELKIFCASRGASNSLSQ